MAPSPFKTFLSYSHGDESFKEDLRIFMAPLVREGKLAPWQDRDIEAGQEWDALIRKELEAAQMILLLVTPRFLASPYCFDEEMTQAMARHERGQARVVPIIIKPCDWETSPFRKLQALPKDGKPVTQWPDPDAAWLDVVKGLRRVADSLLQQGPPEAQGEPMASQNSAIAPPLGTSVLQQRLALMKTLSGLPKPQFEQILFGLDVPAANRPAATLPQGERATELLNWATSDLGCGLETLAEVIDAVLSP